jgi:quinol monooxygenase YgiN
MNSKLRVWIALFVACLVWAARINAQQPPTNPSPLYVLTFIDLLPPGLDPGTVAIKQYVDASRKEPGIVRAQAVAQIAGRTNHLMIVEVWKDQAAFEKHEGTAATLDFRKKLAPLLGAPFDQRVSFVVE